MTFQSRKGARACARTHAHQRMFASPNQLLVPQKSRNTSPLSRPRKKPAQLPRRDGFQGEGEEGRKAFDKICRGNCLAWSSQSFIKVNWPVERTRWAWPSISWPIVSSERTPPARRTPPLHRSPGFVRSHKVFFHLWELCQDDVSGEKVSFVHIFFK